MKDTDYSTSKIDTAVEQLDWSIRLFLDHQAFVPAITLAGAAEEIIGKMLQEKSVLNRVKKKLSVDLNLSEQNIYSEMNKARNWFKHGTIMQDEEIISFNLEGEAIQYIVRALANLAHYDNSLPSEGPRFLKWLEVNRKDLLKGSC